MQMIPTYFDFSFLFLCLIIKNNRHKEIRDQTGLIPFDLNGNSSEIKVAIDFRSNFVHWILILSYENFKFEIKEGGAHAH